MSVRHETRIAAVDISASRHHAGLIVQHSAQIRGDGVYRREGTDAFGAPRYRWIACRWQAIHRVDDRSDGTGATVESRWLETRHQAEEWLEDRGIQIGGAYWHAAKPEEVL